MITIIFSIVSLIPFLISMIDRVSEKLLICSFFNIHKSSVSIVHLQNELTTIANRYILHPG